MPLKLPRRFDLVICLEVAEHLPEQVADTLVASLTAAGNCILFSAAIPGQGGQQHQNEQWPQYWQSKFVKRGYEFSDVVRDKIWEREDIEWWYQQNAFLVRRSDKVGETIPLRRIVHPQLFEKTLSHYKSITEGRAGLNSALRIVGKAILTSIRIRR